MAPSFCCVFGGGAPARRALLRGGRPQGEGRAGFAVGPVECGVCGFVRGANQERGWGAGAAVASRSVAGGSTMWDAKACGALNVRLVRVVDGVNVEFLALDARSKAFMPPRSPEAVASVTIEADNAVVIVGLQQMSVLMSCLTSITQSSCLTRIISHTSHTNTTRDAVMACMPTGCFPYEQAQKTQLRPQTAARTPNAHDWRPRAPSLEVARRVGAPAAQAKNPTTHPRNKHGDPTTPRRNEHEDATTSPTQPNRRRNHLLNAPTNSHNHLPLDC